MLSKLILIMILAAESFVCQNIMLTDGIGQHGIYIVGCIWSASPVAVTNTTAACHCSRAMHEHYRTHENIPIVLKSSELIAFSTEADRRITRYWHQARKERALWQAIHLPPL